MTNHRDLDWLLGRRFVADLRVVRIGPIEPGMTEDDRTVVLRLHGSDRAVISLGELVVLVESGIFIEAVDGPRMES